MVVLKKFDDEASGLLTLFCDASATVLLLYDTPSLRMISGLHGQEPPVALGSEGLSTSLPDDLGKPALRFCRTCRGLPSGCASPLT